MTFVSEYVIRELGESPYSNTISCRPRRSSASISFSFSFSLDWYVRKKTVFVCESVSCRITVVVGCGLAWAFKGMIYPCGNPQIQQHDTQVKVHQTTQHVAIVRTQYYKNYHKRRNPDNNKPRSQPKEKEPKSITVVRC